MAKYIVLAREYNRRQRYIGAFLKRQVHKSFQRDSNLSLAERQIAYQKLVKYNYHFSISRLQSYCMLTGHSRSVYRDVQLSRHQFNQMVLNGEIPSCTLLLGKIL